MLSPCAGGGVVKETLRRFLSYFRIEHALILVPVFGFAVYDSVFSAFSSILGVLGDAYPDVPRTAIQMVLSVPPLVSIPGTLLSGFLSSYVRKKRIAEFALAIIFVGGMIPVVFRTPSIYALFACSACVGLGQGLLHPMANAFICQTWDDDGERSRALGFKQAFNFMGEALVALLVGFLALSHWGNAFLVYLGVIPVFLIARFALPEGDLDKRLIDRKSRAAGLKELFKPKAVYLFVLFFFAMMCLYGFHTNIAMLVQERRLGTTADVSVVASCVSIVSFLVGIAYGKLSKAFGAATLCVGFGCLASGMLAVSLFGYSFPVVVAGGVLFGFGSGVQQISSIYYISKTVDKSVVTMAISVLVSFVSFGATLSPLVINGLQGLVFGTESASGSLAVAGCGFAVLVMVEGARALLKKKRDRGSELVCRS
nr:MFS transporter [Gordonibacter massiliensis (ex Traore et al. 2017)]